MNYIDGIIVVLVVVSLFRGFELGFIRQLFSTVGFFSGLGIGAILEPHTVKLAHTQSTQSIVALLTTLGAAFVLLTAGEYLGIVLKKKLTIKHIDTADNYLGTGLAALSVLVAVWLTAAIIQSAPLPTLQDDIKQSRLLALLDRHAPAAPSVIASIGKLIDPNGFPQVFSGNEPVPDSSVSLPNLGDLEPAVKADAASVVKIEGQGCGGVVEGSGFIVASGIVVTNAHVVAGIRNPYIVDSNGTRTATAIWFNPDLDLAVLKATKLAGKPLTLATDSQVRGTPAAVLGYPGGGSFSAKPAAILDSFTATGRNIYDKGAVKRDVYEVRADIIPGNSGGPLIAKDGSVIGLVFAESTAYRHVGYSLTAGAVAKDISQAEARNRSTNTGSCAQ